MVLDETLSGRDSKEDEILNAFAEVFRVPRDYVSLERKGEEGGALMQAGGAAVETVGVSTTVTLHTYTPSSERREWLAHIFRGLDADSFSRFLDARVTSVQEVTTRETNAPPPPTPSLEWSPWAIAGIVVPCVVLLLVALGGLNARLGGPIARIVPVALRSPSLGTDNAAGNTTDSPEMEMVPMLRSPTPPLLAPLEEVPVAQSHSSEVCPWFHWPGRAKVGANDAGQPSHRRVRVGPSDAGQPSHRRVRVGPSDGGRPRGQRVRVEPEHRVWRDRQL